VRVDVNGTRRLLEAADSAGSGHLLYVSIVRADRLPTRYMRFKHDAEQLVMAGGVGLAHSVSLLSSVLSR
jgi:uncharacterized protein YbjT (DUF2867 family)